jgi:hypothetical protein
MTEEERRLTAAALDPRSSPDYWFERFPGFDWAPGAYNLLAQHFIDHFKLPELLPPDKHPNKKRRLLPKVPEFQET